LGKYESWNVAGFYPPVFGNGDSDDACQYMHKLNQSPNGLNEYTKNKGGKKNNKKYRE